MTKNYVEQLVKGLVEIGDQLDLQIFTSSNGAALLDWTVPEHRVLTVWAHDGGTELRVGTSLYTLLPLESSTELARLLGLVEQIVTGSWDETYAADPSTGSVDGLRWQIGHGSLPTHSSGSGARLRSRGVRIHRPGQRWGQGADTGRPPRA